MKIYRDYTDFLTQTIRQRSGDSCRGFDALADIALLKLEESDLTIRTLAANNIRKYNALLQEGGKYDLRGLTMSAACEYGGPGYEVVLRRLLAVLEAGQYRQHADACGLYGFVIAELSTIRSGSGESLEQRYQEFLYTALRTVEMHEGLWLRLVEQGSRKDNKPDTACSALILYAVFRALDIGIGPETELKLLASKVWRGIKHNLMPSVEDGLLDVTCTCGFMLVPDHEGYLSLPEDTGNRGALGAALLAANSAERKKGL